jgi:hypothetical protein
MASELQLQVATGKHLRVAFLPRAAPRIQTPPAFLPASPCNDRRSPAQAASRSRPAAAGGRRASRRRPLYCHELGAQPHYPRPPVHSRDHTVPRHHHPFPPCGSLPEWLRSRRQSFGWSQVHLARLIGVDEGTLAKLGARQAGTQTEAPGTARGLDRDSGSLTNRTPIALAGSTSSIACGLPSPARTSCPETEGLRGNVAKGPSIVAKEP